VSDVVPFKTTNIDGNDDDDDDGDTAVVCVLGCNIEKDRVTCPIKYGGLLLFNNVTPHQRFVKHISSCNSFDFLHTSTFLLSMNRYILHGTIPTGTTLKGASNARGYEKMTSEASSAVCGPRT